MCLQQVSECVSNVVSMLAKVPSAIQACLSRRESIPGDFPIAKLIRIGAADLRGRAVTRSKSRCGSAHIVSGRADCDVVQSHVAFTDNRKIEPISAAAQTPLFPQSIENTNSDCVTMN